MKINDELIVYLEKLSRLTLGDEEREQAKSDLTGIIGYIDKLGELDTAGLPALSHPFPAANRFREDEVKPSYDRAEILANASVKTEEYFKTPKTVE